MSKYFKKRNDHDEKVKEHFDSTADEFDSIYENKGGLVARTINKLFRKAMFERIPISIQESGPLQNKSVLDLGCGSGRASFLLAKEGAKVMGIDYARSMIELAKKYQQQLNLLDNVEFLCCDFIQDFPEDNKYDICIALGVFDYIEDPLPFLRKIKRVTRTKIIASYPAKFAIQSPLRKVWLSRQNCPVFFYTHGELKKIYLEVGTKIMKIIRVPQGALLPDGFIVVSQP